MGFDWISVMKLVFNILCYKTDNDLGRWVKFRATLFERGVCMWSILLIMGVEAIRWVLLLGRWIHGALFWTSWQWFCQLVNGCRWSIWFLIPRDWGRDCVTFLVIFIILSTKKKFFFVERLIIFYLLGLEVVFYAFSSLDRLANDALV